MAEPDVLSGGGTGPPHPRRWLVAGVVLALVLGVPALLDSTRDRVPAPRPTRTEGQPSVVSVAVGARWAYALVSNCDFRIVHECDYRVHRREVLDPGWRALPLHVTGRTTTGLDVTLRVTPGDQVILIKGNELQVSDDGGETVRTVHLRPGSPVAAVPPGDLLASGLCETCDMTITVLDPATGDLRPLTSQPDFTGFGLRLAQVEGDVLWVAQIGPTGGLTAVSADRGRTWRTIRLAPGMVLTDPVVLASIRGGGAYLVGRRANLLPDVRRVDGPDGSWRRLTPAKGPIAAYSAVVDERGLLVGGDNGQAWRLMDNGAFLPLPGAPGYLAGGYGRVLLGLPAAPATVLLSYDGGVSWRAEHVG